MNSKFVNKLVLAITLTLVCQSVIAQAMYRIKPIGNLPGCTVTNSYVNVYDFNNLDEVTGDACVSTTEPQYRAFLWKNDGNPMIDLGPSEAGSTSYGYRINASGMVVGVAHDSTGDFAFESSGDGSPMKKIYDSLGGTYVEAHAINDVGQVTGDAPNTNNNQFLAFVWNNDGTPMRNIDSAATGFSSGNAINASGQIAGTLWSQGDQQSDAFIWKNDGTPILNLGTLPTGHNSIALLINSSGQVAGYSDVLGATRKNGTRLINTHAFFWRNDGTPMVDLGTLGGRDSHPYALNDSGQIAGSANIAGNLAVHAFVWLNNGTPKQDLGTLGGRGSAALSINSSGQVTGVADLSGDAATHAFLWRNDGTKIQDLNNLIDPTDPLKPYVTLTNASFINDRGDILAFGTDSRNPMQVDVPYVLQGTVLTLTPRSLAFGNQRFNTSSAAKSVTMTNTSAKVVAISSVVITGSNARQFTSTNNCGSSLVGHTSCTIKVTFKPTSKGLKSATSLDVNGGGGGLRSVTLAGTGM